MNIVRWRPAPDKTNFGDELNAWLWPRLLPAEFADLPGTFYGIGTVLSAGDTRPAPRLVFGAGTGYHPAPAMDDSWQVRFVRGPLTAQAIGGGVKYLTDPAILVRHFYSAAPASERTSETVFIPRWDSVSDELRDGLKRAGILLVDPTWPVETVINAIRLAGLVLTEALHGAVVADALRVPWVSIYASRGHERKWQDWTASMDMIWNPIDAAEFSLAWARDYAVPQLSAKSVLDSRFATMTGMVNQLVKDIVDGRLA